MAIAWSVAFRETLDDHVQMGQAYTRLAEVTTGEGGDRSRLGYEPARLRFQQIPSKVDADGDRLLDAQVNASEGMGGAYQMTAVGWAFALTMRFYIERRGRPTTPTEAGDADLLSRQTLSPDVNTPERSVLIDLPLEVQNILLASGLISLNVRSGDALPGPVGLYESVVGSAQTGPSGGGMGDLTELTRRVASLETIARGLRTSVDQAERDAQTAEGAASRAAMSAAAAQQSAAANAGELTMHEGDADGHHEPTPDVSSRRTSGSSPHSSMLSEVQGRWHFQDIGPRLVPDADIADAGKFAGVVSDGSWAIVDAPSGGVSQADFDALESDVDTLDAKTADISILRDEVWVAARGGAGVLNIAGQAPNTARVSQGQLPTGSYVVSTRGTGVVIPIVRLPVADSQRDNYRLVYGGESVRLDDRDWRVFHTASDFVYLGRFGRFVPVPGTGPGGYDVGTNAQLSLQHHGTRTHLRWDGEVPVTPTSDNQPASKKYVDDNAGGGGGGGISQSQLDSAIDAIGQRERVIFNGAASPPETKLRLAHGMFAEAGIKPVNWEDIHAKWVELDASRGAILDEVIFEGIGVGGDFWCWLYVDMPTKDGGATARATRGGRFGFPHDAPRTFRQGDIWRLRFQEINGFVECVWFTNLVDHLPDRVKSLERRAGQISVVPADFVHDDAATVDRTYHFRVYPPRAVSNETVTVSVRGIGKSFASRTFDEGTTLAVVLSASDVRTISDNVDVGGSVLVQASVAGTNGFMLEALMPVVRGSFGMPIQIGPELTVTNSVNVQGPAMSALPDFFMAEFEYTRSPYNAQMQVFIRKALVTSTGVRQFIQGSGADNVLFSTDGGDPLRLQLRGGGSNVSSVKVRLYAV